MPRSVKRPRPPAVTSLRGADLSRAEIQGADLSRARMQGANLSFARMQGALLGGARMQGAVLPGAKMQGADLEGSSFQYTDMIESNQGKLSGALVDKILQGLRERLASDDVDCDLGNAIETRVSKQLREREGQAGTWKHAAQHELLLCDDSDTGPGCITDVDRFHRGRAEILAEVACAYDSSAFSMAVDIYRSAEWDDGRYIDVRPALRRLLADDCDGATSLSEESRSRILMRIAELTAELGPAPEPATTADRSDADISDGAPQ